MWELDRKEGWVLKNCCFWIGVLKKTLESPLNCKEIKPVNPKGNQSWIFLRRTDAEAEAPVPWPPDVKSRLFGKNPNAEKDWRQKEKGAAEDEMVREHHRLKRHEFEQTLGDSEGQGSLACCSPAAHVANSCMWFSDWAAAITLLSFHRLCITLEKQMWLKYSSWKQFLWMFMNFHLHNLE